MNNEHLEPYLSTYHCCDKDRPEVIEKFENVHKFFAVLFWDTTAEGVSS